MGDPFDLFRADEAIPWPGSTSGTLVPRLQRREVGAWADMLRLYAPVVYRWCRRIGVPEADLADVAQDVLATASRGIDGFAAGEHASFRGWLWTLARSRSIDHLRRGRRRVRETAAAGDDDLLDRIPCAAPAADDAEPLSPRDEFVRCALDALRPRFREPSWQAFWRTVVGGEAPEDVARDLGLSVNAVYVARSRILRRLRDELGDPPAPT